MSQDELSELVKTTGLKNTQGITKQAMVGTFQAIFRAGGFKSYQLTVIIANIILKALIGRGLSFGATTILTKTMSVLVGPIGLAVSSLWAIKDIAGPAYRVTIPVAIQIAVLRRKYLYDNKAEEITFSYSTTNTRRGNKCPRTFLKYKDRISVRIKNFKNWLKSIYFSIQTFQTQRKL